MEFGKMETGKLNFGNLKMKIGIGVLFLAFFAGGVLAQTMNSAAELVADGSPICKILSFLPIVGGVLATTGGFMAAYNYMSQGQESKMKATAGIEGIIIGGGLILLVPMIVGYLFGFEVCPI